MPTGPRRGGGSSDRDDSLLARFAQLEQQVRELHGARGGSAGGGARGGGRARGPGTGTRGGGGGGNGGAAGSAAVRSRPGDWACEACGAFPCFARTTACYACRAPRMSAAGATTAQQRGGGHGASVSQPSPAASYLGPRGANGSRPLLGGRGLQQQPRHHQQQQQQQRSDHRRAAAEATCPSVRVPGASVAARAEQQRAASAPAVEGVTAGEQRGASAPAGPQDARAPWSAPPVPPIRTANRWSALDEASDDGSVNGSGDGMEDIGDAGDAVEEEAGTGIPANGVEEDAPPVPTPAQLRLEWDKHSAALRLLERDPGAVPPSLIDEARRLRDQAESRWRAAKPQQPLHKRVRWAEVELREAQAKEDGHRKELEEHLAATARRTRELEARLEVDRARTERKKAALADLRGREAHSRCPATESAARIAITGISMDVAPAMSAIAASLGEGDADKRRNIQAAILSLSRVEEVLREGTRAAEQGRLPGGSLGLATGTVHYNIDDDTTAAADDGPPSHPSVPNPPTPPQRWTRAGPVGQWKKARTSADAAAEARSLLSGLNASGGADPATRKLAEDGGAGDDQATAARAPGDRDDADDPARTNDLAEAARRAEREAQRSFQESQRRQLQPADERQQQVENEQRDKREQQQQLELQRHQAALEKAAAERAAEEARQREELVSRMSPAELARAAEVHAQQQAVAAHAFGSLSASQVAGLVHQAHVENVVQDAVREGAQADHAYLMSLSPEDLAQWERDRQGESGAVPW